MFRPVRSHTHPDDLNLFISFRKPFLLAAAASTKCVSYQHSFGFGVGFFHARLYMPALVPNLSIWRQLYIGRCAVFHKKRILMLKLCGPEFQEEVGEVVSINVSFIVAGTVA
jgi:hypothetical protein